MTPSEIKAVWAARITSCDEMVDALNKTRDHSHAVRNSPPAVTGLSGDGTVYLSVPATESWFVRREAIRELVGVYPEPSSVLKWLRSIGLHQYFPHVSRDDPKMVAYTIDRAGGLADKQVRTTMGKLLRKFLLVVTDAEIARLEAWHRADMDDTFELATTPADIEKAFTVTGDSSCMRYTRAHWGLKDYHPSAVYSGPGMGVAFTRNGSGEVNARTVVWTNPDDAADKRYVRIYGDQALKRRLESAGYRMAGLAGAKLAAIQDSVYPGQYVMPWIDPAGGIHANARDRTLDAAHVVKYKGEDFLRLLGDAEANRLINAGLSAAYVRQQGGRISVDEIDPAEFIYTCVISGATIDRLTTRSVKWINDQGVTGQASQDAMTAHMRALGGVLYTLTRCTEDGAVENPYCTRETQEKFGVPGFSLYFNDAPTRRHAGINQLDTALYGENQYAKARDTCEVIGLRHIKRVDAMRVFNAEGEERYEHVGAVKALRKQGYVATAVIGKSKAMSHTGNPALVVTAGGRKALKGLHAVIEMHDGRWEYMANTVSGSYLNRTITVPKGETLENVRLTAERIDALVGDDLRASHGPQTLRSHALEWLSRGLATPGRRYPTYYVDAAYSDRLLERASYCTPDLAQVEAAVARLEQLASNPVQLAATVGSYNAAGARFWAHHARLVLDLYHAEVRRRALEAAEANAVEAPARLGEPTAGVVAKVAGVWNDERFAIAA